MAGGDEHFSGTLMCTYGDVVVFSYALAFAYGGEQAMQKKREEAEQANASIQSAEDQAKIDANKIKLEEEDNKRKAAQAAIDAEKMANKLAAEEKSLLCSKTKLSAAKKKAKAK